MAVTIIGDEGWQIISGDGAATDDVAFLTRVAWPYRAVQLIGETTSAIPFVMTDPSGNVLDDSTDWRNVFGAWPYPKKDIYRIAASLVATGQAYLFPVRRGNRITELRYVPSHEVQPLYTPDQKAEFVGFMWQQQKYQIGDFVYFWYADHNVDSYHPPIAWPARSAFSAAGALYNLDDYVSRYFANGAVRSMLLGVPASTQQAERERIEGYFNRFITGLKNAFRVKTINADDVKPTIIGDGLDALQDKELTDAQRTDICVAFGVPKTRLFSDASTNATADADVRSMTLDTALPLLGNIIESLNEQLFSRYGLRMVEMHESMEIFQQNEADTAGALAQYVNAFSVSIPLAMAMCPVLGIELPEETVNALNAIMAEQDEEQEPEPAAPPVTEETVSPEAETPIDEPDEPEETEPEEPMSEETKRALRMWYHREIRVLTKEKKSPGSRPFVNEHITPELNDKIIALLSGCTDEASIHAVFAGVLGASPDTVIKQKSVPGADDVVAMMQAAIDAMKAADER